MRKVNSGDLQLNILITAETRLKRRVGQNTHI